MAMCDLSVSTIKNEMRGVVGLTQAGPRGAQRKRDTNTGSPERAICVDLHEDNAT
jgi:hypothetical protein